MLRLVLIALVAAPLTCAAEAESKVEGTADWSVVSESMSGDKEPAGTKNPVGLGILFSTKPGKAGLVERVVKGSPADKIGITPGTQVVAVNGQAIGAKNSEQIAMLMSGKAGGTVKLTVRLPQISDPVTYDLERAELPLPLVFTTDQPDRSEMSRDLVKPEDRPFDNTSEAVIDRLRK